MRRFRWWLYGLGCLLVVVVCVLLTNCSGNTLSSFDGGDVEQLKIELDPVEQELEQPALKLVVDDQDKIEQILSVLKSGTAVEDHKCGDTGTLTFRYSNGKVVKIGILAGHQPGRYEFRIHAPGSNSSAPYSVDRQAFEAALAAVGVNSLQPNRPE